VSGISNIQRFLHTDPADVGCQHALALLHLYAERELDDRDAADHYPGIAAHLAACGACAEDLRGLLALLTTPWDVRPRPPAVLSTQPAPNAKERGMSVTVGFLALLEAKPDRADELAAFLEQGRELALAEPLTVDWYAFRIDQVTYGIFDTFEAEAGREAHLAGEISKAFIAGAPELLAKDPDVRPVDVIAVK
jgi:quinol monooxygenase YgiN